MNTTLPLLLLLTIARTAQAQSDTASPSYSTQVEAIVAEGLARGEAFAMLERLCSVAPHRLSGSPGAAAAVEWGRQEMERLQMENIRLEPCLVPHWIRGAAERLRVVEPAEAAGDDLAVIALGGSVATPDGGLTGEVVMVQSFDELAALGERARGKVVFFNRPMDPTQLDTFAAYGGAVDQRTQGAVEAAKVGAVGVLVRSMTGRLDNIPHTGGTNYSVDVPKLPAAAVSTEAAEWIAGRLAAGKRVVLHLELHCQTGPDVMSANVVGELRGREHPEEIVLVGGHLDCWDIGQGAQDDGAGCVQSLEVVRLLKALDLRPRRTIRVVLFMNEENGLRGGRTYAQDHAEELPLHRFALESDRGGFAPRGFTTDAKGEVLERLRSIAGLLEGVGANHVQEGGGGADISFLSRAGVPLIGYLPDSARYFDVHHSSADVLAGVNPRELQLGAIAMAGLLFVLADQD